MAPYLVHIGYVLMLATLVARDVLWLRATMQAVQPALWARLPSVIGRDLVEKIRRGEARAA